MPLNMIYVKSESLGSLIATGKSRTLTTRDRETGRVEPINVIYKFLSGSGLAQEINVNFPLSVQGRKVNFGTEIELVNPMFVADAETDSNGRVIQRVRIYADDFKVKG